MTMARYSGVVQDQAGNIITNAKIEVRRETPGQPLAAIKSDREGLSSLTNPFNANADGTFAFHAVGGAYKIRAYVGSSSAPTFEDIRRYEPVGLLQEYDIDAVLIGKRQQVRVATTANITISTALNNGDTLDGVTLATNDLVLVKDQTSKQQNGIYVVGAVPARAAAFDTYDEHAGAMIAVVAGTAGAGTVWFCTANAGGTLDTTAIDFTKLAATAGPAGDPGEPGEPGPPGPATIEIGTVTTLAPGEDATATNSGDAENFVLDLGIPAGAEGPTGPVNELAIGTVTEGPADATITGAAPSQILNLVLPKGDQGEAFSPDEVVALIADRDAFDGGAKNFAVLVEADSTNDDLATLYFKLSASSGDWSGGFTFGGSGGGSSDAVDVAYDNSTSGLTATDVQAAIDEIGSLTADYGLITSSATATDDYGSVV